MNHVRTHSEVCRTAGDEAQDVMGELISVESRFIVSNKSPIERITIVDFVGDVVENAVPDASE